MNRRLAPEERVAWLCNLGLSETEARAYVALAEVGVAPASDVAKRARVPRNRVYDALDALAAKDLVDIRLEGVRTYAARGVRRYLGERRAALARRHAELEARRPVLQDLFGDPAVAEQDDASGGFRVARGRRDATDLLVRLLRQAESSVHAWTSGSALLRLDNHAAGCEAVPRLADAGLDVRLVVGGPGAPPSALAPRVRGDAEAPAVHRFVFDRRTVALLDPGSDDDRVYVGDDLLLVTDNPALVREADTTLGTAWTRLGP